MDFEVDSSDTWEGDISSSPQCCVVALRITVPSVPTVLRKIQLPPVVQKPHLSYRAGWESQSVWLLVYTSYLQGLSSSPTKGRHQGLMKREVSHSRPFEASNCTGHTSGRSQVNIAA